MRLRMPPIPEPRDILFPAVVLLSGLGTVMVFSAGAFHDTVNGDTGFYLRRQLSWLPLACLAGIFCYQIDYRALRRFAAWLLVATIVCLVLALLPGIGVTRNGSSRWIGVGGMTFQPSEAAKLALIVFLAAFLANDPTRLRRFWRGFVPASATVFVVFLLVLVEPDLGTSVFLLGISFLVMLLAGMRLVYLVASAVAFAPVLGIYGYLRWEQIYERLLGFLRPDEIYQVRHSLLALGSGGWLGRGLGAGVQKHDYLPEIHTDFVLSNLGEELGFAGSAAVIALFLCVLWGGARIAWRSRDYFGFLLAGGMTISIVMQAALNVAVVTASVPTKGIPLPLLTFGGSGLCMTLAQVGLLLSIDRVEQQCRQLDAGGIPARVPRTSVQEKPS